MKKATKKPKDIRTKKPLSRKNGSERTNDRANEIKAERKILDSHLWHVEYPTFQGAEHKNKNTFFEKFSRSVITFCQSDLFPEGAKYYATYRIIYNEGITETILETGLRKRGHFIRKRRIFLRWDGDTITNKEITEIM